MFEITMIINMKKRCGSVTPSMRPEILVYYMRPNDLRPWGRAAGVRSLPLWRSWLPWQSIWRSYLVLYPPQHASKDCNTLHQPHDLNSCRVVAGGPSCSLRPWLSLWKSSLLFYHQHSKVLIPLKHLHNLNSWRRAASVYSWSLVVFRSTVNINMKNLFSMVTLSVVQR